MLRHVHLIVTGFLVCIALLVVGCGASSTPTTAPPAPSVAPTSPPVAAATATTAPAAPAATSAPAASALQACGSGTFAMSSIQTPVPVTLVPTIAPTVAPTAAAPTTPLPPTATPRPAPATDRVGYPDDYQNKYKLLYIIDRGPVEQVRVVCGNDAAAAWKQGQPFPYGSIIAMETWRARRDASGGLAKDSNGHLIREALTGLAVMRKDQGFGADYKEWRSGEWEYVAFRPGPDKQLSVPPPATNFCAACHLGGSNTERDWTFFTSLFFTKDHYKQVAPPSKDEVVVSSMAFSPGNLSVKVGTTVKWRFDDVTNHTITAKDSSFSSGTRASPGEFSFKFDKVGVYQYVCSIHPEQMSGRIEVKE